MRRSRHSRWIACVTLVVTIITCHATAPLSASRRVPAQAPQPASEFQGWRIETFGPVVVASDDAVRIGSTKGPGGLFFRRTLAAEASYRLTIVGQSRSGQTTVRLTVGRSKPQWFPAPNGRKTVTFTGSASVEVVVYGDTPYEYRLQDLALEVCDDDCAQPAPFGGWQVESFGAVEWTSNAGSMTLASLGQPGGLFFRRAIDPGKTYRLQIAGKALSGGATVRLTLGTSGPTWFRAPDGDKRLAVSASASIEVVVYGDAAYSYHLDALALDECAGCLTDRQLATLILADVPTLQIALERDRTAAARALLNWTANIVDLGFGDSVEATTSREYEMGAAEAYQELWLGDRGGTACAGFADFFVKVLSLFGFEAFTLDFGDAATHVTHVTTIALIEERFYVLDPTFNGVYVDAPSGALLPLRPLLARSLSGAGDYEFRTGPIKRDFIFPASQAENLTRRFSGIGYVLSGCQPQSSSGDREAREVCKRLPFDERLNPVEWTEQMSRRHVTRNGDMILSLMRHHVFSFSATDQRIRQRFLEALTECAIPFGPVPD